MAALLYRGKITEAPISEGENDNMLYQQYIHEVRPDMLKLYIALNQPKQKNGKELNTDIKIAVGGNSPILINNKDSWLENKLNDYLHGRSAVNFAVPSFPVVTFSIRVPFFTTTVPSAFLMSLAA